LFSASSRLSAHCFQFTAHAAPGVHAIDSVTTVHIVHIVHIIHIAHIVPSAHIVHIVHITHRIYIIHIVHRIVHTAHNISAICSKKEKKFSKQVQTVVYPYIREFEQKKLKKHTHTYITNFDLYLVSGGKNNLKIET
jgi:hypothetical protein